MFVILTALLGAACVPQAVYQQHAALHGCSESQVKVWRLEPSAVERLDRVSRYRASGCGHDDIYYCRYTSCRTARKVILDRHVAEFGCERDQVEVRSLGGGAWLADGCGERRTYNCFWASGEYRCVAETESRGD